MVKHKEHLESYSLSEVLCGHVPEELLVEALGPKARHHYVLKEYFTFDLLGYFTGARRRDRRLGGH